MENKKQYETNLKEIQYCVMLLKERNNELSLESKNKFAKSINKDRELLEILLEKKEMSIEIQERFLSYLRVLVADSTMNA
jgi:hypothetical protein